jgi:hypothetical protein
MHDLESRIGVPPLKYPINNPEPTTTVVEKEGRRYLVNTEDFK